MRPHSLEAFLARVKSSRSPEDKPLEFKFVGATQSVCVDQITTYNQGDVEEVVRRSVGRSRVTVGPCSLTCGRSIDYSIQIGIFEKESMPQFEDN